MNRKDVLEIIEMPEAVFEKEVKPVAYRIFRERKKGVTLKAMIGYTNICRNHCHYCGMSADMKLPVRYRLKAEEIEGLTARGSEAGLRSLFLISGDDPLFKFDDLLRVIASAKEQGYEKVTAASGEFSKEQYRELKDAGLDEYVMKFEMSNPESFNRFNPSTTYKKRRQAMEDIREAGMLLATGNICGWPGQTKEELADDILLMKELNVSWVPVIPYMPVPGTKMAELGGRGELSLMHKEISIMRIMLPDCGITAQQPGRNLGEGLGGIEGNVMAIDAGADILFQDILPKDRKDMFRVVDRHMDEGIEHAKEIVCKAGVNLLFE